VDLVDRDDGAWAMRSGEQIATRTPGRTSREEISACATCHSRRQLIAEEDPAGGSPLNKLRPALLEEGLYHSDGQIQDEVYVYGSFLQSAMYAAGVTCSNCHDPHSARLRATGNALCSSCHLANTYDSPAHHFHELGTPGAECVSCHMPTQTYMGVDSRRDHSIRVPRPDLTVTLGSPNACTQCHGNRPASWAAEAVTRWYGAERPPHYGEVLARGRQGVPTAGPELAELALDPSQPGIARATALDLLRSYGGLQTYGGTLGIVEQALLDQDPLVRFGAIRASEAIPPEQRYQIVYRMLEDSTKLVRTEAARVLASVPRELMPQSPLLENVTIEYVNSQLLNSDRPEAYLNTGVLHAARGDLPGAVAALETALHVDSAFAPAYVNLADLMRAQGREVEGERLLRVGIARSDDDGAARHALGLSLVRQQRLGEALVELRRATETNPLNARFAYVYAVALQSTGQVESAIAVLEQSLAEHPYDLAILTALVTFNRDTGDLDEAIRYSEMWVAMAPDDARAAEELADLVLRRGR
jgi:predicted CXXCH cytochrome family protein